MTAFLLTGSNSNNAVGYEKHHHKHLGWHTFSAAWSWRVKSQRPVHLSLSSEQALRLCLCCICSRTGTTSATTTTQPQISVPLWPTPPPSLSHINQDKIWPFLLNLQLLPPPGKAPSFGLGHKVPWKMGTMYRQHTAKEASTSAWCPWKDGTEGVSGRAEVRRAGPAPKLFIKCPRRIPLQHPVSLWFFLNSHTLTKHSLQPIPRSASGTFCNRLAQSETATFCTRIPAVAVTSLKQIQMWLKYPK